MSAPGADPLAAIRQKRWLDRDGDDVNTLLALWDTRESALRALVAQDRSLWTTHRDTANTYLERGDESSLRVAQFHNVVALIHQRHAEAVERLLSGPQPCPALWHGQHNVRMNHLDIEQPIFGDRPHIWVQWKGTDVCCDIHCSCGEMSHFDGDFFYFFKCLHCGQHWEVGTHVSIYPVTEAEALKSTDFVKVPQP